MTDAQRQFLRRAAEASVRSELKTDVPAEFTLAQAYWETGGGQRMLNHNCFGIKRHHTGAIHEQYGLTNEYIDGSYRQIKENFEYYATLEEAFDDHGDLIRRGPYRTAWSIYRTDGDFDGWIHRVCKIYAKAPDYEENVHKVMRMREVRDALAKAREPYWQH